VVIAITAAAVVAAAAMARYWYSKQKRWTWQSANSSIGKTAMIATAK